MLLVGSDDGVYRVADDGGAEAETTQVLKSGRVVRLRTTKTVNGIFAATRTGLFWSADGKQWTDLTVPQEHVYSVATGPFGERLYAGTRPAHVYVAELNGDDIPAVNWHELDGLQDLPSREEWRLPRHENLAQVRDLHTDPAEEHRIIAGVEVGGVHVSDDGGETWTERMNGLDRDIHELHVVRAERYAAATGHGLFMTTDAGLSWTRLDRDVSQGYFRSVFSIDETVYASGALSNSATWNDEGADPALFRYEQEALEQIAIPAEAETVTGMTAIDSQLIVATHRGNLFRRSADGWDKIGQFPVSGEVTGRYTPIAAGTNSV